MYDCVVIGGGPGGYACALHLAELGAKVAVIEKDKMGGCCTNHGCIPTKTLYAAAEVVDAISNSKRFGINAEHSLDYNLLLKRKQMVVETCRKGMLDVLKKHDVEIIKGTGRITGKNWIDVNWNRIHAKNIVIATGSTSADLPDIKINHENVIDSADMLNLSTLPETLLIIGAGSVGVEFAGIFSKFGAKVTLVEMMPNLLPGMDQDLSKALEQSMRRSGIDVRTATKVLKIENTKAYVESGGSKSEISAEKIMVAVGRKPFFNQKEMAKIGIRYEIGITVDDNMRTSVDNIYAVGDVTGKIMLAHAAMMQGTIAAENMMGKNVRMDYTAVPQCVFSFPSVAGVGTSNGRSSIFPFSACSRALCDNRRTGFVKVVAKDDVIVGVHIIGQHAPELIAEAALAVQNKMKLSDILKTVHAHPTYAEAFFECVRALNRGLI